MNQVTQSIEKTKPAKQPPLLAVKEKMKATWEDGDYASFARYMEAGAVEILEGWNIKAGQTVLDVGCGAGQTAIPAARAGAIVTGIDIASNLVNFAKQRAVEEKLNATFAEGDAENIPYADESFEVVISMIGAMFAPRPDKVASELGRVCKSGGRLHMANWTPDSFPAQMFKCVGRYVPPPAHVVSPVLWGEEDTAFNRLTENFKDIQFQRRFYPNWKYPFGTKELVEFFRINFGPVKRAFSLIDKAQQKLLRAELEDIYAAHNIARDGTSFIKGEYLDITAIKR